MPRKRAERNMLKHTIHTNRREDEVEQPSRGEMAIMLHKDMIAHRKRTADFNAGWKRTLCFASIVLVALSLYQAVDKTRRGDSGCLGHVLTLINGCIVGSWVGIGWLRRGAEIQSPTDWLSLLAIALSLFQLALWSTSIGPPGDKSDFPADIILVVVAILSSSAMNASLKTADCAFRASDGLARRVSASVMQN